MSSKTNNKNTKFEQKISNVYPKRSLYFLLIFHSICISYITAKVLDDASTGSCYVASNTAVLIFGILLTVGTSLSYLPQQIQIIQLRSSLGLSNIFLFLSGIFGWGSLLAISLTTYSTYECCFSGTISFLECNEMLVSIYQIAVMPINVTIIHCEYLLFLRPPKVLFGMDKEELLVTIKKKKKFAYIVATTLFCLVISAYALGSLLIHVYGDTSKAVTNYARIVSGIVFLITLIQYLPQIYTTYKGKTAGSVSALTLCIQAPGNFFVVAYQILAKSSYIVWFPFLSTGVQQTILTIMIIFYDGCCNSKLKKRVAAVTVVDEENTSIVDKDYSISV